MGLVYMGIRFYNDNNLSIMTIKIINVIDIYYYIKVLIAPTFSINQPFLE